MRMNPEVLTGEAFQPPALRALSRLFEALHHQKHGDVQRAWSLYEEALALDPDQPQVLQQWGILAFQCWHMPKAVELLARACAVLPGIAEIRLCLGRALDGAGQQAQALACLDEALTIAPDLAEGHAARAGVLRKLGRLDEAASACAQAIAAAPQVAEHYIGLGAVQMQQGHETAARASFEQAAQIDPTNFRTPLRRGVEALRGGRHDEAIEQLAHAAALAPDEAEPKVLAGYALLAKGEWERGWPLVEHRWRTSRMRLLDAAFQEPLWRGHEPLEGKSILLFCDQGLGDTLMMCRFARTLAERGARVVLKVQRPLMALLRDVAGVSEVHDIDDALATMDFRCPLYSLPNALGLRVDAVADAAGYLRADPSQVAAWAARLGPRTAPRVGIVWCGSPTHEDDHKRSLPFAQFAQALPSGLDYVVLQDTVRVADEAALAQRADVLRLDGHIRDFTDTAALCELMDVVVSMDTSAAHLGGALGRPTWVVNAFPAEYRWLQDREDSPWYDSVRLFRQARDEPTMAPVLARLRAELERLARA